ncbi:MAG: ATP-grasp domain-containing protein [Aureispira sp.]
MLLLFCDSGFSPKEVDYFYAEEQEAAQAVGYKTGLFSLEALRAGGIQKSLQYVPKQDTITPAVYRGWMLKPQEYEELYKGLQAKNIELVNRPEQYVFCHHLPASYEVIKEVTPKTTFQVLEGTFEYEDFEDVLGVFGEGAIIVKDYVKSQKHYWNEACYIPKANDRLAATKVIQRFIELQGEDLNEGLVFRAFVPLKQLTTHSKSGMPLTKEFRLFVYQGAVLSAFEYWEEGDYEDLTANWKAFEALIPVIDSNFFTMDIAQRTSGEWIIVELGDGQVAGLMDKVDKKHFYQQWKNLNHLV